MLDFENRKRDCVDAVEQDFLKKFATNSQNKKQFHKDLYEACIMDVICTYEDLDISYVVKREEPDFVLECDNDVLAVEVRKVECKENDIKDNQNNQYARWGKIRNICAECEKELDKSIYGQKFIYVKTLPKLFDLNIIPEFVLVKKSLMSVIMGNEKSNDYWTDVEILPNIDNTIKTSLQSSSIEDADSFSTVNNELELQNNKNRSPNIFLHGNLIMEQLTVEHIKNCIRNKEEKLPTYKHNLLTEGYSPTQYWLILDVPNDFSAYYDLNNLKVHSVFDRIYLVDLYYKQEILRLK